MSSNRSSALLSAIAGIREELRGLNATLTTIASELTREPKARPASRPTTTNAQLLSSREAARRLGVDRNTTLAKLIRTGQLRTVETSGRIRIPAAEVERFAKAGSTNETPPPAPVAPAPPRARKTRQRRHPRPAASPDIRNLDF